MDCYFLLDFSHSTIHIPGETQIDFHMPHDFDNDGTEDGVDPGTGTLLGRVPPLQS
jgi:hypothetical protein